MMLHLRSRLQKDSQHKNKSEKITLIIMTLSTYQKPNTTNFFLPKPLKPKPKTKNPIPTQSAAWMSDERWCGWRDGVIEE